MRISSMVVVVRVEETRWRAEAGHGPFPNPPEPLSCVETTRQTVSDLVVLLRPLDNKH